MSTTTELNPALLAVVYVGTVRVLSCKQTVYGTSTIRNILLLLFALFSTGYSIYRLVHRDKVSCFVWSSDWKPDIPLIDRIQVESFHSQFKVCSLEKVIYR